jgi:hypothetical protein
MWGFDRERSAPYMFTTNPHRVPMKNTAAKKSWTKPSIKTVPIFFECTCYAAAV